MPTISVFYGIVIQMFWRKHNPQHFDGEHEALFDLRDLRMLRGALPRRAMVFVLEWTTDHWDELIEDWTLCSQLKSPKPIAPLT